MPANAVQLCMWLTGMLWDFRDRVALRDCIMLNYKRGMPVRCTSHNPNLKSNCMCNLDNKLLLRIGEALIFVAIKKKSIDFELNITGLLL